MAFTADPGFLDCTQFDLLELLQGDENDPLISAGLLNVLEVGHNDRDYNDNGSYRDQMQQSAIYCEDDEEHKMYLHRSHVSPGSISETSEHFPMSPLSEGPEKESLRMADFSDGGSQYNQATGNTTSPSRSSIVVAPPGHRISDDRASNERSSLHPEPEASTTGSSVTRQDKINVSKTVDTKRGVKRKAVEVEEEGETPGDSTISRNKKNALAAKENRLKRKMEWEDLNKRNSSLEKENESLRKDNSEQLKTITELEEELVYFKSVLFNDSSLAKLLQSMNPKPNLKLSSSMGKPSPNVDPQNHIQAVEAQSQMRAGVCLHVNGTHASLEFCSKCSLKAQA